MEIHTVASIQPDLIAKGLAGFASGSLLEHNSVKILDIGLQNGRALQEQSFQRLYPN